MVPGGDSTSSTGDVPSTVTVTPADSTGGSTSVLDTTESASSGPDSTDGTTGDTTGDTTGEEVIPGQTVSQVVTAGTRTTSANYTLVYTFGQPSQLQNTHQSASYRLQGGLIGANGSPP